MKKILFSFLLLAVLISIGATQIGTKVYTALQDMLSSTGQFDHVQMAERSEPATPPSGQVTVYVDEADKDIKTIDSTGTVTNLTTGVAGGGLGSNLSSTTNDLLSNTGILKFGGTSGTYNESLSYDFETTENEVGVSSVTGALAINYGTLLLKTAGIVSTKADNYHKSNDFNSGDYAGGDETEGDEHYNGTDNNKAIYEGGAWNAIPHIMCETWTIAEPDTIADKTVVLKHFMAEAYPNGVTIRDIAISASSAMSDTHTLQAFDTRNDGTPTTIEAIVMAATVRQEDDGTLTSSTVPADGFLVLELDPSVDNVDSMEVTCTYVINAF